VNERGRVLLLGQFVSMGSRTRFGIWCPGGGRVCLARGWWHVSRRPHAFGVTTVSPTPVWKTNNVYDTGEHFFFFFFGADKLGRDVV
jgi:hypothetical protein